MYDHNANNIHAMCGMTYAPAADKGTDVLQPVQGYDANGSPVTDELSKDLIEAARESAIGG